MQMINVIDLSRWRGLPHNEEHHSLRCHDCIFYKIDNRQKGPPVPIQGIAVVRGGYSGWGALFTVSYLRSWALYTHVPTAMHTD